MYTMRIAHNQLYFIVIIFFVIIFKVQQKKNIDPGLFQVRRIPISRYPIFDKKNPFFNDF